MTATTTVEGFSLSHAAILDGSTGAEYTDGDIYGIEEGSLDPNVDSFDNTGDDTVLSTWSWLNFANINVKAGYIPFKLIALLTGESITSSGAAPNDQYSIPLWTSASMNVSPKPMVVRMPSRDSNGLTRTLDVVLYKVEFMPITFDGPKYKDGLKVNYNGRALLSLNNEAGVSLGNDANGNPKRAVGRLISKP